MGHKSPQKRAGLLDALSGLQKGSNASTDMCHLIGTLSNAIDDALIITDHQFTILLTNQSLLKRLGYQPTDLDGKHLSGLFTKSQWPLLEDACLTFLSQPGQQSESNQTVYVIDKNRHASTVVVNLQYLPVEHGTIFVFRFGDATHRPNYRNIAKQIRQQHLRLQALGRLSAGLAHEYNNLLTSIVGYSDILKMRLDKNEALFRYVEHISHASSRAADLTRHVMAFTRHHSNQPEMCDLNAIISDMEKMLRGLFEDNIELIFRLTPHPATVWIDLGALLQILIIVLLSVREALTRGSKVSIATESLRRHPECTLSASEDRRDQFITLMISYTIKPAPIAGDQHGDPPLELQDLHDDFVAAIQLLREVGGELKVVDESAYKKTYKIYLPVTRQPVTKVGNERILAPPHPDSKTILVVDDEDMIRVLIREALQMEGYQVLEASRPTEALDISRQYNNTIHLLVSDVVMPGMNGRELADHLVAERPHLRLLFISGHSLNVLTRSGIDSVQGLFLQKPFSTSTLVKKVRSALAHS